MKTAAATVLGTLTLLGAVAFVLVNPGSASGSPLLFALVVLVAIVAIAGALVGVAGSVGADDGVAPAPWTDPGALVDDTPERSRADDDVSGERLAAVVAEAGATARADGTVDAGVAVVRPQLREALVAVLVRGGTDRASAERVLSSGEWTDDATAAAVLDEDVDRPGWSLLERFEAWLFPEQVVRREVGRAMGAVAAVAEAELPTVPGQRAPRTVPVLRPTLEDLQRGADGNLQRAVDPLGARTGSRVDGARRVDDATTVGDDRDPDESDSDDSDDNRPAPTTDRESTRQSLADVSVGSRPETDEGAEREEVGRR